MSAAGMRALVTGGRGFVGRHLARVLAERGWAVAITDREDADVCDAEAIALVVRHARPDAVFHLAAQASVARSFVDPEATREVNARGAMNVLEAVARHAPQGRVVLASSADVYGIAGTAEGPLAETTMPRPVSPYAESKLRMEEHARALAARANLHVVIARSFSAVGPGQPEVYALASFARQLARIARGVGAPVLRVGNLSAVRDFVDVRDVARAYEALATRGAAHTVYNICSGIGTALSRAVEELVELAGVPVEVEIDPARFRPADVSVLVGNPTRIETETGWHRGLSLRESLADLYAWQMEREIEKQ